MEEKNETFSYTHSAKEQEEVGRIFQKYAPPGENKMEQLRRLDERAERPGKLASLIVGIISALVFGVGMCCTMVWTNFFVLGVVVGIIGLAGMGAAYPISVFVTKGQREKLAPEILRLSRELMD